MNLLILALVLVVTIAWSNGQRPSTRIVGGSITTIDKFPFIVSLRYRSKKGLHHFCAGSLVASNWVVTAAHCMGLKLLVVGGTNRTDEAPKFQSKIAKTVVHYDYDEYTYKNDIALLQLENPFEDPFFKNIAMEKKYDDSIRDVVTIGWGVEKYGSNTVSKNLKYVKGKVLPYEECKEDDVVTDTLGPLGRELSENEICTLSNNGEGPCQGDSGGPTVSGTDGAYTLIGTVSLGKECAKGGADIFMRISTYYEWIKKTTGL